MKTKIIAFIIALSSISVFGQKLELEKASPFTAVKWKSEQPIVQFKEQWYSFEKLEIFSKKEILDFCKKQYGHKWKKRFSEDLVEVLNGLNYFPNIQVDLILSKDDESKTYKGTFTIENRQSCLMYNRNNRVAVIDKQKNTNTKQEKTINKIQAIADLKQFKEILDYKSSYAQLSNYDYKTAIKALVIDISNRKGDINVAKFSNQLQSVLSEFGDRHSTIKNESFDKNANTNYSLRLPFGVTVLEGKLIAVRQNPKRGEYDYYLDDYKYIKSINGVDIEMFINTYNYRDKKAPKEAKLTKGANALQKLGALLFKSNKQIPKSVQVVFTNGKTEKVVAVNLTTEKQGFTSNLKKETFKSIMDVRSNKTFDGLSKKLNNNVGYIKIPMMFHPQEVEGLEGFITSTLNEFADTKSLIIDLRDNPGGGREILKLFANYIVQPDQSPWVANVAYLRTNDAKNMDEHSMSGRFLYSYNSEHLSDLDRKSIDIFSESFKIEKDFDKSKFSSPFYMVLHAGKTPYNKPVYILVNENSFSAATVFTSAFKGLKNVKIVGVTTDGSSGNSRKIYLNNSNIRVKVSTMLSFQRNGKTLDGNGTEPDIYIPIDSEQILTGKDTQLEKLVEIINK
ncbi:S41 family peptidase [uncultured Lacinutrix sp.]|uniref:S41 family peptidase n=1 Tax=uncultured Lacinutrix sp. TaxID=574032 RepID=UPI00263237EF|nr:S41 family peptidase [uncultured Lacinutrix sp.]